MSTQIETKQIPSENETDGTKPRYEPPKLILLNELAIGKGDPCYGGSSAVSDGCTSGTSAVGG
jgi:hypothetical protein